MDYIKLATDKLMELVNAGIDPENVSITMGNETRNCNIWAVYPHAEELKVRFEDESLPIIISYDDISEIKLPRKYAESIELAMINAVNYLENDVNCSRDEHYYGANAIIEIFEKTGRINRTTIMEIYK